ncbi:MAG: hypothetical protein EHM63_01850 [Actinobacteria bacterium]|nr:MAG: hypothetical protein EHM63_01850 [Actinomycetota bacterium]
MADDPDLTLIRKMIKQLLAEMRPDRYTVSSTVGEEVADEELDEDAVETADAAWLDDVAAKIAPLLPTEQSQRLLARNLVRQMEGAATRSANALLRKIARSGQPVLDWMEYSDYPIAVTWEEIKEGRIEKRQERVTLRAAEARELDQWELVERRRAAKDFAARNEACDGAQLVAKLMRAGGFMTFAGWAASGEDADS